MKQDSHYGREVVYMCGEGVAGYVSAMCMFECICVCVCLSICVCAICV